MQQLHTTPAPPNFVERLEQPLGRTAVGLEQEDVVVLVEPVAGVVEVEMTDPALVLDPNQDYLAIR